MSSGRPYDETEWNLKPDEIGDLHLVLPSNASGEAKLIIQLVATDGAIADAATILRPIFRGKHPPLISKLSQHRRKSQSSAPKGLRKGAEGTLANSDPATPPLEDPVPLPSVLKMTANSAGNIPASNSIKTELAEAQVSDERACPSGGKTGAEGTLANLDPNDAAGRSCPITIEASRINREG